MLLSPSLLRKYGNVMEIVLTITIFVTKYDIKTANIQVITNWRNNLMNGIKNTVKVTV